MSGELDRYIFENIYRLRTDKHIYEVDVSNMTLRVYGLRIHKGEVYPTKKAKVVINFKKEFEFFTKERRTLLVALKTWLHIIGGGKEDG